VEGRDGRKTEREKREENSSSALLTRQSGEGGKRKKRSIKKRDGDRCRSGGKREGEE
jgi:hypothetical protein